MSSFFTEASADKVFVACQSAGLQEEYVDGVEKHDQETQATIERERITTAAVKQLKAEIKDEKSKHEEEVKLLLHASAAILHHLPPWSPYLCCPLPDIWLEPVAMQSPGTRFGGNAC